MPRKSVSKRSRTRSNRASAPEQPIRLQRLLASAGYGSRRQCEDLIETGRVDVDGITVTKLGTTVAVADQKVKVDGVLLKKQKLVYYAVNKPVGFVTTNRDPRGRPRVIDLVPPNERVFPVGRLDLSSEGLLLLTNDGELSQRLTHPKFGVRKVYRVTVAGKVDVESMKKMRQGIYIAEGFVKVEGAKLLKTRGRATEMEIILREGKNREIRRILARLGHKVQKLRRIAVGPLKLGEVPSGAYRQLTSQEVDKLWRATELAEQAEKDNPSKPKSGPKKKGKAKKATRSTNSRSAAIKRAAKHPSPNRGTRSTFLPGVSEPNATGVVIGGDFDSKSASNPNDHSKQKKTTKKRASNTRGKKSSKKTKSRTSSRRSSGGSKPTRKRGPNQRRKT